MVSGTTEQVKHINVHLVSRTIEQVYNNNVHLVYVTTGKYINVDWASIATEHVKYSINV